MQDISYTSKLTQAEDGRPLALDYYIVASDGEPGRYGVKIIEKNSGEQAMAFDLTTNLTRAHPRTTKDEKEGTLW